MGLTITKLKTIGRILFVALFVVLGAYPKYAVAQEPDQPIRALLVIGGCCHDYEHQKDILVNGISKRANVSWRIAYEADRSTSRLNPIYQQDDWADGFDVIVHDECCSDVKDIKVIDRILEPHRNGLPAVVLHCGMHSYRSEGYPDEVTPWFEFTGVASTGHGPQVPIEISILERDHPVMKGLESWTTIKEELYNNYTGRLLDTAQPLSRGRQIYRDGQGNEVTVSAIVTWTNLYRERTRVFSTTLGHNTETVADARYLDLVTRGLLWSVDKLDDQHLHPAQKVILPEVK